MAGASATPSRLGVALDPDKFRLDASEHQAIFEQKIKPRLFGGARPAPKPVAVIFGGQPGAGKSAVVGLANQELALRGGAVEIIGDDLRQFHPHYGRLVGLDDKTAAFYTDRDTGLWIEKSIAQASRLGVSVVIEGTMRDSDKVAATMKMLRDAGFEIDARALAVHHRLSIQGILMRYEGQKQDRGWARMTKEAAHQAGFDGLPITLARIEVEKLADRVSVMRRGGEVIYANYLNHGEWVHPPMARRVLDDERQRPLTVAELSDYAKAFEGLAIQLLRPERHATAEEIHHVYQMRHEAVGMLVDALSLRLQMARDRLDEAAQALARHPDNPSRST